MANRNSPWNRPIRWSAGLALSLMLAASVQAQPEPVSTVWNCWYNGDTRIQCVLATARPGEAHSPYGHASVSDVVQRLWKRPHTLTGKRVFIPLFNEPEDWGRVRLLAESVMCGASRKCRVEFARTYTEFASLPDDLDL